MGPFHGHETDYGTGTDGLYYSRQDVVYTLAASDLAGRTRVLLGSIVPDIVEVQHFSESEIHVSYIVEARSTEIRDTGTCLARNYKACFYAIESLVAYRLI